jgi:hypothetical protein
MLYSKTEISAISDRFSPLDSYHIISCFLRRSAMPSSFAQWSRASEYSVIIERSEILVDKEKRRNVGVNFETVGERGHKLKFGAVHMLRLVWNVARQKDICDSADFTWGSWPTKFLWDWTRLSVCGGKLLPNSNSGWTHLIGWLKHDVLLVGWQEQLHWGTGYRLMASRGTFWFPQTCCSVRYLYHRTQHAPLTYIIGSGTSIWCKKWEQLLERMTALNDYFTTWGENGTYRQTSNCQSCQE